MDEQHPGPGPAPEHFGAEARRAWDDIVAAVAPGTLVEIDKYLIESTAFALAQVRRGAGADEVEHARLKASVRQGLQSLLVPDDAIEALMARGAR